MQETVRRTYLRRAVEETVARRGGGRRRRALKGGAEEAQQPIRHGHGDGRAGLQLVEFVHARMYVVVTSCGEGLA